MLWHERQICQRDATTSQRTRFMSINRRANVDQESNVIPKSKDENKTSSSHAQTRRQHPITTNAMRNRETHIRMVAEMQRSADCTDTLEHVMCVKEMQQQVRERVSWRSILK